MAFSRQQNVRQLPEKQPALGYINISLPKKNGKDKQVGFIKLEANDADAAAIATLCETEEGFQKLISKLQFSYNAVDPNASQETSLDLD